MLMSKINKEYLEQIEKDYEESRQSAKRMQEYADRSQLYYDNRCFANMLHIPKVYSKEVISDFEKIVEVTYGIFEKVIQEYIKCVDYRKLFPFSKELEELILVPNLYDSVLPIARFDIFYQEDTGAFSFCEINTDGTSAMNEDRIANEAFFLNTAHQKLLQKYVMQPFELFDTWVDTFLSLYQTYEKAEKGKLPQVAIIDFLANGTIREFEEFARRFQKKGMVCEICDITSLTYHDGVLYSPNGMRIDAIYRRAVTSDIMKHYKEVQPFVQAVLEQNVFLAGSFTTQIIHNKWLFHVLHLERTKEFLTDEEKAFVEEHIPYTVLLNSNQVNLEKIIGEKNDYIIKPLDSYASNGVFAGVEYGKDEWEQVIRSHLDVGYICQKYCKQYRTQNIDFLHGDGTIKEYINMAGLYVYNGKFAGVFSRFSEGGIIASHRNERMAPTLVLNGVRE